MRVRWWTVPKLVVGVVVGLLLVVGACVAVWRSRDVETLTLRESYGRVEGYIDDAVDQIEPRPEMEDSFMPGPMKCEGGSGRGDTFLTERAYALHGVPVERNTEVFDTLHDYWTDNGYRVTNDLRDRSEARILQVRHRDNNFSVSLRESIQGGLFLSGSSPCVHLSDYDADDPDSYRPGGWRDLDAEG